MTAAAAHNPASQPQDRRHRRTLRTRAAIEAAALELFTERGFANTTVDQIAEAADIAPRTFFRHFPSKDAVLFGDPSRETERMREVLATRPADEHPMCSLAVALLDLAERIELDRARHLMRAELLDSLANTGEYELHLIKHRWVQDMTILVAERAGTAADDPRTIAWSIALLSCFGSAMHAWLVRADDRPLREILAAVFSETADGLTQAADVVGSAIRNGG
ncbi:TetR family transcriptional regulator [Saccharopolyspora phatthalungensis]|uniref:AcrR family transcriptional regulator n=1 Tax=Saccharopolyspora phatthalungensis TaxID=664693 RepID=A0A840QER6_9PSEU|nr:TetR family transcriptional regulator [Saccharopolyspora phatthalungensis]MBB5158360.1 AcrR family transcriptional regulator [Saccharopolyspora phatthalungensis]